MAVYTHLSESFARYMLSIYPEAGDLVALTGVPAGSINTSYRLDTTTGAFFLRVGENKAFADLVYEKNLLLFLERAKHRLGSVDIPRMVPNAARGYFFPVEVEAESGSGPPANGHGDSGLSRPSLRRPRRGRYRLPAGAKYACLFEALRGRDLAVFETTPAHVEQIGTFLARSHLVLRRFRGLRANPYGAPTLAAWLTDLRHTGVEPSLLERLARAFGYIVRHRRPLPRGVVHGDLFINNTKWHRGQLDAVFDWEMAGRDHLALDLAITVNAWCWRREPTGAGAFDPDLAAALVGGYQRIRPLVPSEVRGFFVECCLAALRFTLSRIRDFGTSRELGEVVAAFPPHASQLERPPPAGDGDGPHRDFLDYREYETRLSQLFDMGPKGLAQLAGLRGTTTLARGTVRAGG